MKKNIVRTLAALLLAAGGLAFASAQDGGKALAAAKPAAADNAAIVAQQKPAYPLATCVISGEKLGSMGDPVEHVVEGRLVRLCCEGCVAAVNKDPKAAIAKVDEAVIRVQKPMWPKSLTTCPVSGEAYGGEMGEPFDLVHGTRYVKLCCKGCKKGFAADPAKFMAIVDKAMIEEQKASYPLSTCPISGQELGDEPTDVLYGVKLVRFCCGKCAKAFEKNPEATLAKLEAARKEKAGKQ